MNEQDQAAMLERDARQSRLQQPRLHVLVIERGSEAWFDLVAALTSETTYKVSVNERRDGIAIKVNESMWTPTLRIT